MRAYETQLKFSDKVGHAIVVEFGKPWRLIFWSKAQYVGCWDLGGDVWFTPEWLEVSSPEDLHAYEPIMDKKLKYSRVSILESGPVRAKIHWHYACCNICYEVFNGNTTADEYYTVYPDGVAVRKLVAWPGNESDFGGNPNFWQVQEYILVNGKGTTPEDVLNKGECFTLQNERGDKISFSWPLPKKPARAPLCASYPQIKDWNFYIGRLHLKGRPDPYVMFVKDQRIFPYKSCVHCQGDHPFFGLFPGDRNTLKHWPATDMENFVSGVEAGEDVGRVATHTSFIDCNYTSIPGDRPPRPCTWLFLTGATKEDDAYLIDLIQSWYNPAKVSTGYENKKSLVGSYGPVLYEGYAFSERAYHFRKIQGNKVSFVMRPQVDVINPVIRVIGWMAPSASVFLDGSPLDTKDFRIQLKENSLLVWINKRVSKETGIEITELDQ